MKLSNNLIFWHNPALIRVWRSAFLFGLALCLLPATATADTLADIKARGDLVWGGDAEGGGPYIFEDPKNPSTMIGYDMRFAAELAKALGVKAKFFQAGWDKLPTFLDGKQIDIITNGYEWTAERAQQMAASLPYYVYGLQMMVRASETRLQDWKPVDQLVDGRKWKIGVLGDSAAEFYLTERYPTTVELAKYEDNTTAMRDVEEGALDITVADTPIVRFFAQRFAKLRVQGDIVGKGYYVVYARKGDKALIDAVNQAILKMIADGTMHGIYQPYQMWDAKIASELRCTTTLLRHLGIGKGLTAQQVAEICEQGAGLPASVVAATMGAAADLPQSNSELASGTTGTQATAQAGELPTAQPPAQASAEALPQPADAADATLPEDMHGWTVVTRYGPKLVLAAKNTVLLSLLSFPLAVLVGLLVAIGRMYGPKALKPVLAIYVEFVRGTPLMLQLFIIYFFGLPMLMRALGIDLTASVPGFDIPLKSLLASVLGLGLNYAAYESEIYRSGLQAIPEGQMEAALSLGMSKSLALRRIIVPQALRITIPPTMNDFIALFKDTSVCSVIAVTELTKAYSINSKNNPGAFVEFVVLTALLYMAMSYPLAVASRRLEQKLARED